jgi:hypothetical protein
MYSPECPVVFSIPCPISCLLAILQLAAQDASPDFLNLDPMAIHTKCSYVRQSFQREPDFDGTMLSPPTYSLTM